jgi:hypothetical protein
MIETSETCPPLEARPMKNTICLFDLDGTLCPEKQVCTRQFLYTGYPIELILHQHELNVLLELAETEKNTYRLHPQKYTYFCIAFVSNVL